MTEKTEDSAADVAARNKRYIEQQARGRRALLVESFIHDMLQSGVSMAEDVMMARARRLADMMIDEGKVL